MKIKQTILLLVLFIGAVVFLINPIASAAVGDPCGSKFLEAGQSCCGGVVTSIISCDQGNSGGTSVKDNGIWGLLMTAINILTAGIGIVAVGGIIFGSILYASAGGSADQVKKARTIIINIVIGLLAYALMYSFLNFIIPGGLFS